MMFLVDSHCHLDSLDYENEHKDVADVLHKAAELGVTHFLTVGTELETFDNLYNMVKDFDNVWLAAAMHPENVTVDNYKFDENTLREMLSRENVIGLGECGLDYVVTPETKEFQKINFAEQINIANECKKPIIVHSRGSIEDVHDILRNEANLDNRGIIHCFCEDKSWAKKCLDLGYYISFSGITTFKNAEQMREACKYVPLDSLLVETDCPYLAPVPKRGKPNQPAFVSYTAKFIAELKGVSFEELARVTSNNFMELFHVTLK